ATGEPGDADPQGADELLQVQRCRLPLDARVGGDDDLPNLAPLAESREERLEVQLGGADPFQGREAATEDMVETAVLTRPLDRADVCGLLDHADHRGVAPGARAQRARVGFRQVAAP